MYKPTKADRLFFFGKHFFTLDGLWMIETENEAGWDIALEIDTQVWIKLLAIILRRVKRHLNLEDNSMEALLKILTFRWKVEGWNVDLSAGHLFIHECPYREIMNRNPKRQDKIPLICGNMCKPFYSAVAENFNPDLAVKVVKSQGLGDDCCEFVFYENGDEFEVKEDHLIQEVSDEDKLFYFERNFFTLDGLWIIEVEEQIDWDAALRVDILVWQRLYKIIFRRVKRYLKIEGQTIEDLARLLSFIWSCEGYEYEIKDQTDNSLKMNITMCPYKAAMDRNPERHERIEDICLKMCVPFYEPALEAHFPNIELKREKFMGSGSDICDFSFKLGEQ